MKISPQELLRDTQHNFEKNSLDNWHLGIQRLAECYRDLPNQKGEPFSSLQELITTPVSKGLGLEVDKVLKTWQIHWPHKLTWLRNELKLQPGPKDSSNNNIMVTKQGTSKAYTLQRLERNHPALYQEVLDGRLSANAAAIKAGLRKKATPLDDLTRAWGKATKKQQDAFLRASGLQRVGG